MRLTEKLYFRGTVEPWLLGIKCLNGLGVSCVISGALVNGF